MAVAAPGPLTCMTDRAILGAVEFAVEVAVVAVPTVTDARRRDMIG